MPRGRPTVPPQDLPPSGNEYRQGEIVRATLRPGKFPGETIAEPTQGKRTPPFVVVEKILPGYFPSEEVDIKVVFSSSRRAAGEVVGPEPVVKEIQKRLDDALGKSEKYWKENLLTSPLHIKSDKIQKRERRDGPPRFEYEFQDTRDGHMPLKVYIPNLPADWDPKSAPTTELLVKSIEIHNRDKRLFGEAWATAFPEPKLSPEQEAKKHVKELLAEIRDPKGANTLEAPLADAKLEIVKKDGRWVIVDIGDVLFHAEIRFDVPKDWSPDKLTTDPVVYEMTDARAEGSKILVRCRIEGVEPGPQVEEAPKEERKADAKAEVKAAKGFGGKLGEALKSMVMPEIKATLEPLLAELDTPELADLKGLTRRLEVLDEILQQIALIRGDLITRGATDDEAILSLPRLLEQKKKVDAERARVQKAITDAKEVWGETIAGMKREMDVPRTARLERLNRIRPMVESAAAIKVYQRVHGTPDLPPGILQMEDLDEVKRIQAENNAVLKQKEDFVYDGVWPEKPGDPDYRLSEMAEDFLIAEMLVQPLADRIAELEANASGAPVAKAPLPPAPAPDRGLPAPLTVPVGVPETAPATVEAVEELTTSEMVDWLKREGFGVGTFVGFSAKSRKRLERIFGLTGLPDQLRVKQFSSADGEIEFDLPDGTAGIISVEMMYRMEQEMAGFAQVLETAGVVSNSLVELSEDAAVTLLRPSLERWITEHPGKPIPTKVRIEGVDLISGEVALDVEGAHEVGIVRVSLETVAGLVTAKKQIKVLKTVGPLEAAGREARLESMRTSRLGERLLSAEVAAGQVWKYEGAPSKHLYPGGNFRVEHVDDEKGIVRIVTAKEEGAAAREKRPAQKFLVTRDQWMGLPKTFVSGPQPEARAVVTAGGTPPESEEDRLLREIKVGQVYAYEGPDTYPFKLNDQFNIVGLNAAEKIVRFVIAREEAAAKLKKQKPQVYELKLKQWKLIKKSLLRGAPTPPTPPAPPPPPAPFTPPAPPVSRPAEASSRWTPPPVESTGPVAWDWVERGAGGAGLDPMEPTGGFGRPFPEEEESSIPRPLRPAPPRPTVAPEPPAPRVTELSDSGMLETPSSFNALVDLMRDRDLINLIKREVKKRAGMFGGLLELVSDPVADMAKRIEQIATESGAALSVNETLQSRLELRDRTSEVDKALTELQEAARAYRQTERTALQYMTEQFNALLSGKKVDSDDARAKTLGIVQKMLERLKKANSAAREIAPAGPGAVRRGTTRST